MNDSSKSKNIPVPTEIDLNYVINSEKRVTGLLKKLESKHAISEKTYKASCSKTGDTLWISQGALTPQKWIITIQTYSISDLFPTHRLSKF